MSTAGGLPAVAHWGADIGELDVSETRDLLRAGVNPVMANLVDEPVKLALLPEHWRGWVGRPGLSGSRAGQDWSPKFTSVALRLNGEPISSGDGSSPFATTMARPWWRSTPSTTTARLALTVTVELTVGGLVRTRATLTNRGGPYQLDDLVLSLPVPGVAREILDFAGRWGKERTPQRGPLDGRHPPPRGPQRPYRTGCGHSPARRRARVRLRRPARSGRVHTGWSGNHTHYAERLPTGEQVSAAENCCCPARFISAKASPTPRPWLYGSYGVGLDAVARRFHRFLRARDQHPRIDRAGHAQRLGSGLLRPRPRPPASTSPSGPRRSASNATCSTTAGSAAAATTMPGWATGRSRPTSGRTACIPWSTGSPGSAWSSGSGSSRR